MTKEQKWYYSLTSEEIITEMSRLRHETVATYIQEGNSANFRELKNVFDNNLKEVMPLITDMKVAYYLYNKEVLSDWENCSNTLKDFKNSLESELRQECLKKQFS